MSGDPPLVPDFLARLARPEIRTVLLAGCGGGFDFVHGMLLYPDLMRLGKRVVIGSYSFGDPGRIGGEAPVVFEHDGVAARRVTAASIPDPYYGPEVHLAGFLDRHYPASAPHHVHAYYARAFTVPLLTRLYQQLIRDHQVDAVVIVDGGSDSLMRGDEEGLGDPIEDAVSVATVAGLEVAERLLLTVGLGADRFNHVSDAASLRAIAELAAAGGFLGAVALAPGAPGLDFYRGCLDHLDAREEFRSVLAGAIVSAAEGHFGGETIPPRLATRVAPGQIYLWPLMAMVWGFDPVRVAQRSLLAGWVRDRNTVEGCYLAVHEGRAALAGGLRPVEELPRHIEARSPRNYWGR